MNKPTTSIFAIIILIGSIYSTTFAQPNCDNDTTGLVSLVDLQTGYYLGEYQGGLYPGGSNILSGPHLNKGKKISKSIKPLDSLGNVDYINGKVIMACFGPSTAVQPFKQYQSELDTTTGLNNCFTTILCNNNGGIEAMTIDNPSYWTDIDIEKLNPLGITREQIQIGWMMNGSREDSIYTMPLQADSIRNNYERTFQALLYTYPNLKILYLSPPYYGGYADTLDDKYAVNREPCSYHANFATKWVIEDQINGDPDLRYRNPGKVAPYILWGPPIWADGMRANIWDGLFWDCADFRIDGAGIHLNDQGKEILGSIIYKFFQNDIIASYWYKDAAKWASCIPGDPILKSEHDTNYQTNAPEIKIYPNPNDGNFLIAFDQLINTVYSLQIVNQLGQIVYSQNNITATENYIYIQTDNLPQGIYFVGLQVADKLMGESFVVN